MKRQIIINKIAKRALNSKVMTIANKLVKEGYIRANAMLKAWKLVKLKKVEIKAAGVTAGKRQEALKHLKNYKKEDIRLTLRRERDNPFDKNAVSIIVSVRYRGNYRVGYLPKALSVFIAPLIDAGKEVISIFKEVRGGQELYLNYGLSLQLNV